MVCRRRGRKIKAQGLFPIGLVTFVFISFEREGVYLLLNEQWMQKKNERILFLILFAFVFISFEREGVYLLLNEQWSAKEERTETTEGRKGGEGSE